MRAFGPCAEEPLNYGRLWERVGALAAVLSARVPEGGVVILSCANRPEFFIAYFGVLAAGRTVFPVHPRLTPSELRAAGEAVGVSAIIADGSALDVFVDRRIPALDGKALQRLDTGSPPSSGTGIPGLMLQSSGTTGLPKIVYRDGPSLDAVAQNVARAAALAPEDRVLGAVPIGHSYGMENAMLGPVWAGACACLCDGMDVPVVTSLLHGPAGVTVLPGGAFMFEMLGRLEAGATGRSSLRLAYSAGSPLPSGAASAFAERFGLAVGQLYGASEVGSVTFNDPGGLGVPPGFDPSSVGLPMDGVRIVTGDADGTDGHVLVSAPSMLTRYVGEQTSPLVERDGVCYFPTGDLGRLDASGRLWITGRLKLLIDIGGVKVNPQEVERVLGEHPALGRCVVVGVPVSETVSRVKAIVTPKVPGGSIDVESLRAFARERLAGHKVPRIIEVRESLPLSPGGKVLRWRLTAEAGTA